MKSWLFGNEEGQESAIPAAPAEQLRTDLSDVQVEGQESTAQPLEAPEAPEAQDPAAVEQITGGEEETRVAVEDGEADTAVEVQLVEVQGIDSELDSLLADGETLEQDTRMVESVADEVAGSAAEGGLTETAARVAEVAVESYCQRWHISRIKVASESFAARSDRMKATKIAMEGLVETIAKGWDAFVKYLKALCVRLKEAFKHYTGLGKTLGEKVDTALAKVKAGLGEMKDKTVSGSFIPQLAVGSHLDIRNTLQTISALPADVEKSEKSLKMILDNIENGYSKTLSRARRGHWLSIGVADKTKAGSATGVDFANSLPGGFMLLVKEDKLSVIHVDVAKLPESLPTPDAGVIEDSLKAAKAALSIIDGSNTALSGLAAGLERITQLNKMSGNEIRTAIKNGDSSAIAKSREEVSAAQRGTQSISVFIDTVNKSCRAAALGTYGYAMAGIKAHSAKAAA